MAKSSINLDRQADARIFPFGTTSAGGDALITINKGVAVVSTVVLDVKGSQNIAGDLNLIGNLNISGQINETSVTNLSVADINITLNKGGTTASAAAAGLFIEGDTAAVIGKLLYDGTLTSKWKIGDGTTQLEIVTVSSIQTLTNKSISGGQITSAVANATLAATVTTNANLTGVITSVGNTTSIGAQTGTGSVFVVNTSPTLVTPIIGVATGTSLSVSGVLSSGTSVAVDGIITLNNATNSFTQSFKASAQSTASVAYLLPTLSPTAGQVLSSTAPAAGVATLSWASVATGSVTSVSVVTANGISGTVATPSSTPAITLTLGAITPTTVNGHTFTTGSSTFTGTAGQVYTFPSATSTLMSLGNAETVSGIKTFLDGTLLLRNVANTFTGVFTNTNTAARTYTLKDASGTLAFTSDLTTFVTAVSIASANGFAGTSSGGTTPALTISTSITGLLKGNGTAISAATSGTDYLIPSNNTFVGTTSIAFNRTSAAQALTGITSIDGSAATLTTARAINGVNFDGSAAITITAAAGTLTGSVLNSTVTTSSLISFGNQPSANNFVEGYNTTATAATTTTLTVLSNFQQYFTGITTQTVLLPVSSTLVLGQQFVIINNSTGVVTVQSSGLNTLQTMAPSSYMIVTCILASGTSTASWNSQYVPQILSTNTANTLVLRDGSGNFSAGTITATLIGNASSATSTATLTTARSIYGNSFDGSASLTQIIASTFGGTGNGFTKFSGPTTAEKTFTLPDASGAIAVYNATGTFTVGQTFNDTTLLLRNVANTFSSTFTNTNTAARIYTLKDASGTLAFTSDLTTFITSIGVTTANGVSAVSSGGTTPNLTITLGAITPTSVNGNTISTGTGTLSLSTFTLTVAGAASITGTNTGDQTTITGNSGSTTLTAITDDTTTNASQLITWVTTASGNQAQKVSSTKLTFNPSTGTLSSTIFSGAGTGLTGTASSLTAGTVTTNANLTGMVTSVGNATTVVTNANLTGDVTSSGNATTIVKYQKFCTVSGTQDGTNKIFTIGTLVKTSSEQVFVNGQLLNPGASNDYVYDGATTVTFQAAFTAPASTDTIRIFGAY